MAEKRPKILAISGSTRSNSVNELLLNFIAAQYQSQLDLQLYNGLTQLPYFNLDLENEGLPGAVGHLREQIAAADGVIICTPEYVFSLPGALKNVLEWTVPTTVFSDKPVALIVAAASGEKAYESLILIMKTLGAQVGEHAQLLISGAKGKLNAQGEITEENTRLAIQGLVASFLQTITQKMAPANIV